MVPADAISPGDPCPGIIPWAACATFCLAIQACQTPPRRWLHRSTRWRGCSASVLILHDFDVRAADRFQQLLGFRGAEFFILRADDEEKFVARGEFKTFLVKQRMMQARKLVEAEHPDERADRAAHDEHDVGRHKGHW